MPFETVKLTLKKGADGRYFVSPSPATVRWKAKQTFHIHKSDPRSNDPGQPVGQPFQIGESVKDGLFRTAPLIFVGKIDDSTDVDNWHPCFASSDKLFQAMDVTDFPTVQSLEIDLSEQQFALRFFSAVHAAVAVALHVLIGIFTLRVFKRSKDEKELEPAHTEGH